MRVAELSERTGVSVPTIKYYLREGLLPRGERTGPNQARYDESHERRLRLVRALVEVGGLSIAATRDVLASLDEPGRSLDLRLGRAMGSVTRVKARAGDADRAAAKALVEKMVERHGWDVLPAHPAYQNLVEVVAALRGHGAEALLDRLDGYVDVAERAARVDIDVIAGLSDLDAIIETAVVGTLVGDTLISALRRLAQANESGRVFGRP